MHQMETNYEFNFKITCNNKSKYVTVEGTSEYASSYIAGYIQAMKDKGLKNVEVEKISANTLSTTIKPPITSAYRSGEGLIKAETILASWLKYCRESKLYRILEFFGLK